MTTEDLQGQVARSAAVERELREQIGKLREELAEAKHRLAEIEDIDICRLQLPDGRVPGGTVECARMWHAEAQRFWKERDAATARAAAAESALAEARGAVRLGRAYVEAGTQGDLGGQFELAREQAKRDLAVMDAALARAGEQETPEPRCMAVTRNGHRCDLEPHEEVNDYREAENAAEGGGTLLWSERYAPASSGQEVRDAQWATAIQEAANCVAPRPAEPGFRVHNPIDRPRCGCSALRALLGSPSDKRSATPPPGEQSKGGGDGLRPELANHLLYVHPLPWRVGRKVARNVYDAHSEGVAMFTHAYTAAIVVEAVNRLAPAQPAEHPGDALRAEVLRLAGEFQKAAREYERGGSASGAAQMRRVSNLLYGLAQDGTGLVFTPVPGDEPAEHHASGGEEKASSRVDFQCDTCGHRHVGRLGGICIGCPCERIVPTPAPGAGEQEEG